MIPDNIPKNAIGIYCEYGNFKGKFWVWPTVGNRKERWQWSALGQNGEENKREEAITAARRYVMKELNKPTEGETESV